VAEHRRHPLRPEELVGGFANRGHRRANLYERDGRRPGGGAGALHYTRTVSTEHATVAEEEYLQIMFWLHEAGLPITGANTARAMQLSAPTVHEMIGRLERDGYVERLSDKSLVFTDD